MLLEDRVALVTGASRGIGAATARALAGHGAAVGVNYFESEEAAREVVSAIRATGGNAVPIRGDAREPEYLAALADAAEEALGPVDTLVLNAHVSFPIVPFLEYRWEDFEAKLTGELGAAFHACKVFVPRMMERERGCVIAVSSALSRQPGQGFCAHASAKSGLDAFMKSLALELGPAGIRVNVVAPGLTLTDATADQPQKTKDAVARVTPLRRNALAEDVAGVVVMLASDEARFVTGAYLPVSGGIQKL
jgi:3-oxoacyl-[acyl-carrier protein] reductase